MAIAGAEDAVVLFPASRGSTPRIALDVQIKKERKTKRMKEEKIFQRSPMTIVCYVLAVILLIFAIRQMVDSWATIKDYYSAYEMGSNTVDNILYMIQSSIASLTFAFVAFISGFIISEIRKGNPDNYKTKEEILAAKEAKKLAKAEAKAKTDTAEKPAADAPKQN